MGRIKINCSISLGIYLLILTLLISCQSRKVNLELTLEKGVTYRQQMESDLLVVQTINGLPLTMSMSSSGKLAFKVISVSKSGYQMEGRYERLSMKMEAPNLKMNFSSEKINSRDTFSTLLSNLKDKPFIFNLGKTGKILDICNMDNLFFNLMQHIPLVRVAQKEQIRDKLREAFGKDAFRRNMEMVTAIFPSHPISLKETWKITTPAQESYQGQTETSYTLFKQNETCYSLSGKGNIDNIGKDSTLLLNGLPIKSYIKGFVTSEITIANKTGWIINGTFSQQLTGSYTVRLSQNQPWGMLIPVHIINKIRFSR